MSEREELEAVIDDEADGEAATAALEDYHENGGVSLAEIATPKPDSPVCVEVMPLIWSEVKEWPDDVVPPAEEWRGATSDPRHSYQVSRAIGVREWRASIDGGAWFPSRKAAIASCDEYHERRTLELVNARSVESVKAELLKALHAKALKETNVRFNGDVAEWLERAGEDLRSLIEGEG
jgi:hypothetical protein